METFRNEWYRACSPAVDIGIQAQDEGMGKKSDPQGINSCDLSGNEYQIEICQYVYKTCQSISYKYRAHPIQLCTHKCTKVWAIPTEALG